MQNFGIALSFFIFLFVCRRGFSFADGDFQYWNTVKASYEIRDDWRLCLEEEVRLGNNVKEYYYEHSDIGLFYKGFAKWFEVGANYRHVYEESGGEWYHENRPHVNAVLKWKIFDFNFSNRVRFEYRNKRKERADDYWRFRNKFAIKLPIEFTKFEIQPFVADEFFYDYNAEDVNRNRVYGGFSFRIEENLSAEIYYLWQVGKSDNKWKEINVLGTSIKYSF